MGMRFLNYSKIVKHMWNLSQVQDYLKLTLRENPDQIIGVTTSLKSDTCDVLLSSITVRKKVAEVNIVFRSYVKKKTYII